MKSFKKLLALFLCVMFCLSLFPSMAFAEEEQAVDESAILTDPADISDDVIEEGIPTEGASDVVAYENDEAFSDVTALEVTGDGAISAASAPSFTIDLPTYVVFPPTLEDISDETMLVDYEIDDGGFLSCNLKDYIACWFYGDQDSSNNGTIAWSHSIDGITYVYNLLLYDMNLSADPYGQQHGRIIVDEFIPNSSGWSDLSAIFDINGNFVSASYMPTRDDPQNVYTWDATLQSWWVYDSESGSTIYNNLDGLTPYYIPFYEVHFTGETLVLWDAEGSHGKTDNNGLVLDNDGVYRVYKNGVFDPVTKFIEYEGGLFYVKEGVLDTSADGLVNNPDDPAVWYFCSNGQVQQQYSGLAEYDGAWFYLSNGVLDTTSVGIVNYDGGRFMIAAGRILREVDGLIQDPNTGLWYYISAGQVADYTGLAQYDGAWFYITDGMLAVDYTGWVKYDGRDFYVVNGMVA